MINLESFANSVENLWKNRNNIVLLLTLFLASCVAPRGETTIHGVMLKLVNDLADPAQTTFYYTAEKNNGDTVEDMRFMYSPSILIERSGTELQGEYPIYPFAMDDYMCKITEVTRVEVENLSYGRKLLDSIPAEEFEENKVMYALMACSEVE